MGSLFNPLLIQLTGAIAEEPSLLLLARSTNSEPFLFSKALLWDKFARLLRNILQDKHKVVPPLKNTLHFALLNMQQDSFKALNQQKNGYKLLCNLVPIFYCILLVSPLKRNPLKGVSSFLRGLYKVLVEFFNLLFTA